MLQLREDRRNLSSTNDAARQQPPLKGGQHLFQNADMEIDQLATALISLTFGTKAFFDESEDLMSLDAPIIVFLDGIIETGRVTLPYDLDDDSSNSQIRSDCPINIEYNLDAKEE